MSAGNDWQGPINEILYTTLSHQVLDDVLVVRTAQCINEQLVLTAGARLYGWAIRAGLEQDGPIASVVEQHSEADIRAFLRQVLIRIR